jgi:O-antigen/teichoic acid export membrane protein
MFRNVSSNWIYTVVTIGVTYVMTPYIIHAVGQEGYGTWSLIVAMTGYMGFLALGVPMACVRYLTEHLAARDTRRLNETIGTCAALYLSIGVAALLIGATLMGLFGRYAIPGNLRTQAYFAFGVMVVTMAASFIGYLPEGIMFAHHDFVRRNTVRIVSVILRFGLTLGLLALHASLAVLALVQLACLLFDFGVSFLLVRRRYPGIHISIGSFQWREVRRIFSFSLYVVLLDAGLRLSFETDALVIGAFLDVRSIPYYVVANSLIVYLMEFVKSISSVVSPMATRFKVEGRDDDLQEMFLKWSKITLSMTIMMGGFVFVLGPRFIGWWIDPSYERPSGQVLQILMASAFVFMPVRGVAVPILMGLGKPLGPTVALAVAGAMNLVLSIALARPYGLAGVAIGTAIPTVIYSVVVATMACREIGLSFRTYLTYVVPRATIGTLPMWLLLLWFKNVLGVQGITGLATAGCASVVIFGLTWILFVYRGDPYIDLKSHVIRIRAWGRA